MRNRDVRADFRGKTRGLRGCILRPKLTLPQRIEELALRFLLWGHQCINQSHETLPGFLAKLESMTDELKQEVKNELRCPNRIESWVVLSKSLKLPSTPKYGCPSP